MQTTEHPIRKVTAFVLSEWAMMMVEPAEFQAEQAFNQNEKIFRVSCHYEGVFDGYLAIICQRPFMRALAQNLLGIIDGEETTREQDEDALRELANVISGNFLLEAYGAETVFELPKFELVELNSEEAKAYFASQKQKYLAEASACYTADENPVVVFFHIDASDYDAAPNVQE